MMRTQVVVVIGASGFIGRYTVRHLAAAGHIVRVIVRRPSDATFLKTSGDVGQITIHHGTITRPDTLVPSLDGADRVINLVGVLAESQSQTFDAVHHQGPANLAALCQKLGLARLVHVSALAASANSESLYARSKFQGEQAVLAAFHDAIIVRPSLVFGPEDNFFNLFAHLAVISPVLPLLQGGHTRFQPVYVDDLAQALVKLVLLQDQPKDHCYELGGPDIFSFRELLTMILAMAHRKAALVPLPGPLARAAAWLMERLPNPLLTRDQLQLLKTDSVVSGQHASFEQLNIPPRSIHAIVPTYLNRYRPLSSQESL